MRTARLTIRTGALVLTVLAAGCSRAADDPAPGPAPGGVSAQEAAALNDAAVMVDANAGDAVVVTNADDGAGNVE